MKEAIARSTVDPQLINYVTVGTTMPTDSRYAYVSRVASIQAGLSMESVAMQVSRLCASGLQGIVTTAQNILLGDADYGIGGGVEVMSKAAYLMPALRSGARMGDTKAIDSMVAVLTDPFGVGHMGITAENLAAKHGITREEQDAFAVESQRRAAAAIDAGYFKSQIVPIVKQTRKGEVVFDTDEHLKRGTTMESLAKMKPAFKKDGTVTAGNASGINDGAAFFVLADGTTAVNGLQAHGPPGFLRDRRCAERHHGRRPDPGVAHGAQEGRPDPTRWTSSSPTKPLLPGLSVAKVLGLDPAKTNPNGGAIALGHPVGCSGAFIATKALRAAAYRRPLRAGHDVYRWRPGHCHRVRAHLIMI
jgi:acetyl-CoA C-acetyltransferase